MDNDTLVDLVALVVRLALERHWDHRNAGRQESAREVLDEAARVLERLPPAPGWVEFYNALTTAYESLREFPKAELWCKKAMDVSERQNAGAWFNWAVLHLNKGSPSGEQPNGDSAALQESQDAFATALRLRREGHGDDLRPIDWAKAELFVAQLWRTIAQLGAAGGTGRAALLTPLDRAREQLQTATEAFEKVPEGAQRTHWRRRLLSEADMVEALREQVAARSCEG